MGDVPLQRVDVGRDPAKARLEALRAQARRRGGWLLWFAMPAKAVCRVFASVPVDDAQRSADPIAVLEETLHHTEPPSRFGFKGWPSAYGPSSNFSFALPKTATGEWKYVGRREVPDPEHQDSQDAIEAFARGLESWRASAEEAASRTPDRIVATRHVRVPADVSEPEERAFLALDFLKAAGFRLYGDPFAEWLELHAARLRRAA